MGFAFLAPPPGPEPATKEFRCIELSQPPGLYFIILIARQVKQRQAISDQRSFLLNLCIFIG